MANIPYPNNFDDDFMNIFKEVITMMNQMGYTYEESLQKAREILEEAQQTNDMNESVQQQINTLIAESGTSDAEVLQARIDAEGNEYTVLKERLDAKEQKFSSDLDHFSAHIARENIHKSIKYYEEKPNSNDLVEGEIAIVPVHEYWKGEESFDGLAGELPNPDIWDSFKTDGGTVSLNGQGSCVISSLTDADASMLVNKEKFKKGIPMTIEIDFTFKDVEVFSHIFNVTESETYPKIGDNLRSVIFARVYNSSGQGRVTLGYIDADLSVKYWNGSDFVTGAIGIDCASETPQTFKFISREDKFRFVVINNNTNEHIVTKWVNWSDTVGNSHDLRVVHGISRTDLISGEIRLSNYKVMPYEHI
ncbi:hypothetical protein [Salinicoccus roseus]|uniref:Uncharacterized protein n=1 Tax=Salinicoccus roseus TaxID=45670 RepID=A0A265E682_9STAP|nr:hypothetical protein [Salinicoccus roseus]OZT77107.1 hypothetical protein CFN03_08505 [Salinicoccus roseus]